MRLKGITSSSIVTICSHNQFNAYVTFVGAVFLGAKVASLDPTISHNDSKHLMRQVNPDIIFCTCSCLEKFKEIVSDLSLSCEIVVFEGRDEEVSFEEFLKESDEEDVFAPATVDVYETVVIIFSSGTTGLPKGICLNPVGLLEQVDTIT